MWTRKNKSADITVSEYDRDVLKSSVVSLFWNILSYRKRESGFTLTDLAAKIGVHKSAPSRWFGNDRPNWEENTMADIANALGVELEVYARDKKTGVRFAPYGAMRSESIELGTDAPQFSALEWAAQ